ncbi:MAG: restriction endonuclease subunit S [Planctomycetota bacterium]
MSEWRDTTIEDLVEEGVLERPLDGNHGAIHPKSTDFVAEGIPFIMASDMINGRVDITNCSFITRTQADSLKKGFSVRDDVLLSHKATIGRTAIVQNIDTDFIMLTPQVTYYRVRDKDKLNNRYLKYYFDAPEFQNVIAAWAGSGSTRAYLGITGQLKLPVRFPCIDEQLAIARVLGSLDDKIEQNRRTSAVLERLARAVFRAWFVDFEPVHAKAAGATSFPSMPQTLFDQLPTAFQDSPKTNLGPTPQGWEVKPVSEAFDVNPKRPLRKGDVAPYLDMKSMPTQGHAPESWIDRAFGSGMRFMNGDTLVARITPCLENGKTAFVDFLEDGQVAWGSTEYIVLRPKDPLPAVFAYCLARSGEFRDFAIQNMSGTSGRQRVAATAMDHYQLAVPPEPLTKAFGEIVQPMFDAVRAGMNESRKLAELRDYLLPRLISGTVRVRMEGENA